MPTTNAPHGDDDDQVVWTTRPKPDSDEYEDVAYRFDDIERMLNDAQAEDIDLTSFGSPDLAGAMEALGVMVAYDYDDITINGIAMRGVWHPDRGAGLVPKSSNRGIEILASAATDGSTGSIPGMAFDDDETLLRLGTIYWCESSIGGESAGALAGSYEDPTEGLAAVVALSTTFHFDDEGQLYSEM